MNTFCSRFLLPCVNTSLKEYGSSFINAHIVQDGEVYIYVICVNNEEDPQLISALVRAKINPNYIETEIVQDEIIIKFKIPQEELLIYKLFINGKYSKFPEDYKQKLVRIYGDGRIRSTRYVSEYDTIYPLDFKRKQIADYLGLEDISLINEVLDAPDMDYEIYKPLNQLITNKMNATERE